MMFISGVICILSQIFKSYWNIFNNISANRLDITELRHFLNLFGIKEETIIIFNQKMMNWVNKYNPSSFASNLFERRRMFQLYPFLNFRDLHVSSLYRKIFFKLMQFTFHKESIQKQFLSMKLIQKPNEAFVDASHKLQS